MAQKVYQVLNFLKLQKLHEYHQNPFSHYQIFAQVHSNHPLCDH